MIDDLISQWANEIIVHQIIDSFVRKIGQTHIPTLIVGVTLFAIELADRSVIVSIAGAKNARPPHSRSHGCRRTDRLRSALSERGGGRKPRSDVVQGFNVCGARLQPRGPSGPRH
jgi:hypothetical protein